MVKRTLVVALAAVAASGALTSPALARGGGGTSGGSGSSGGGGTSGGGGGGGSTDPVLTAPAISPGTFDGIGSGPVYIHDSFGHSQRTRFTQNGSIIDVVNRPDVDGIRAEYPNNQTETWFGEQPADSPSWQLAEDADDPFEPFTPLQQIPGSIYLNGVLVLAHETGGPDPDTRPNALLPFPAPADSASTVSADVSTFGTGETAIGFSRSSATNHNFENDGQAWLELDTTGVSRTVGNTGVIRWTFHTDGLNGATVSGTSQPAGVDALFTPAAVSYDPVDHVAAATVDGVVVASAPYTAQAIKYVGVEGFDGALDNFTVRAGTVTDPPPDSVAAPTGS